MPILKKNILLGVITFSFLFSYGQERKTEGDNIENSYKDLKRNKVISIDKFEITYKNRRKKSIIKGKKHTTELYDSLGRMIKIIFYNDSTELVEHSKKYFYADTIGEKINRIEYYNAKDSLININDVTINHGEKFYFLKDKIISSCGTYLFKYNDKRLIHKAIWIWDEQCFSAKTLPYYEVVLIYKFKES